MSVDQLVGYWCSPFFGFADGVVDEQQMLTDANPIVFSGGRGTGKTMFLRYFSHEAQAFAFEQSDLHRTTSYLQHLKDQGGVGLYIRIDGALIRDFEGRGVSPESWDAVFCHYFELEVCHRYLELASTWSRHAVISQKQLTPLLDKICACLGGEATPENSIQQTANLLSARLQEVRDFRAAVSFEDVEFRPTRPLQSGDLIDSLPRDFMVAVSELQGNFRFLLLIDEYENFSERQQRILNTRLKFPKENSTYRIGMRLEGFHTTDTVSKQEFLKIGRDYTPVVFEDVLTRNPDYQTFLKDIARKRLAAEPFFRESGLLEIQDFLGNRENLEEEARQLTEHARDPSRHLRELLTSLPADLQREALEKLSYPENPLLEVLNGVWVHRGRSVEETWSSMNDYLNKRKTRSAEKYRSDYVDKYKMSLMFLLASIHRRHKQYYSFNTFAFLSSGIVGNFLELCRCAFQRAAFESEGEGITALPIPPDIQTLSARQVARNELDMIGRISVYGTELSHLANSLGNTFSRYHTDRRLRYPETNGFSIDLSTVTAGEDSTVFKAGVRWSVVQKKKLRQRKHPSDDLKSDIYTINRVLAPVFQISCRTRGGEYEDLSGARLREFLEGDSPPSRFDRYDKSPRESITLPLFGDET